MAEKKFSISEALRFGWDTTLGNLLFFIGVLILAWLIPGIPNFIAEALKENKIPSIALSLLALILNIIISIGLIRIALIFCDNEKAQISELFSDVHLFFKFLFVSILYMLIIAGGLILLIVPGIIWLVKFQFAAYLVVDREMGPIEALKKSAQITSGAKGDLLIFWSACFGIIILGLLALIVGLFVAIPTTALAYAFVYRKLLAGTESI